MVQRTEWCSCQYRREPQPRLGNEWVVFEICYCCQAWRYQRFQDARDLELDWTGGLEFNSEHFQNNYQADPDVNARHWTFLCRLPLVCHTIDRKWNAFSMKTIFILGTKFQLGHWHRIFGVENGFICWHLLRLSHLYEPILMYWCPRYSEFTYKWLERFISHQPIFMFRGRAYQNRL